MVNPITDRYIRVKDIRIYFYRTVSRMTLQLCDTIPDSFPEEYQYISLDLTYEEFLENLAYWKLLGRIPIYVDKYSPVSESEFIQQAKRVF